MKKKENQKIFSTRHIIIINSIIIGIVHNIF